MAKITLYKGDITELETDAIVNAANNQLWMGGGVAGAIKRKGGVEIEKEAIEKGPIPIGEAVVTGAGRLKARYVIHAAAMGYEGGRMFPPTADTIREATKNSLLRAEELGIRSIAFPALGTGVGGFPLRSAAEIMIEVTREHLAGKTCLEEVIFALYGEEAFKAFEEELAKRE
jgi:O-acetyl-ADP-ribose deacetylase (regulator of RNase III)